ncbi:hypothetical protein HMPREF1981_00848 [Bacteroides pyogenes F0041]|uniref:Uncharacterized protein n=1 Tax=Bacteroides pyogenes F0041 TaxID=1321819 RepID=U2DY46_9BACE|nr:hypothetical protein HMPREF1981_00848 [Bacteroides pyogenes F0041]GAE20691.1 hypothetical protein JCM10003_37 [Bacteroides pyogenes JCM 10003]
MLKVHAADSRGRALESNTADFVCFTLIARMDKMPPLKSNTAGFVLFKVHAADSRPAA